MRKELAKINGIRSRFEAIFVRFGSKTNYKGYPESTVLFSEIKSLNDGKILADHVWFTCGKRLDALHLCEGDIVQFDARVTSYIKGYRGYRDDVYDAPIEKDYRLSFPTKLVKVLKSEQNDKLELFKVNP